MKEGPAEIAGRRARGGRAREKKVEKIRERERRGGRKKEREEGNSIVRSSLGGGGADKRTEIITVCRSVQRSHMVSSGTYVGDRSDNQFCGGSPVPASRDWPRSFGRCDGFDFLPTEAVEVCRRGSLAARPTHRKRKESWQDGPNSRSSQGESLGGCEPTSGKPDSVCFSVTAAGKFKVCRRFSRLEERNKKTRPRR